MPFLLVDPVPFGFRSVRRGDIIVLLVDGSAEKSKCLLGGWCNGDRDGLPLLTFLEGEESRPADRRGVPLMRLLRGDLDLGKLRRRALLTLRMKSKGSIIVPKSMRG